MKKLFFIFLLLPALSFGQVTNSAQVNFGTLTDLRSTAGQANVQVFLNGLSSLNDGNGGSYMWSAASTGTDDGFLIVKVTNVTTGRWLRLANGNTIKQIVTVSGTLLQTAYPVTFPSTLPFTPALILTQPYSQNAAALSWITNVTSTGFTINFLSVPVIGTNNITFGYLVIKQ